ncbi:inner membrane protein YhjD [Corynebacterium felinum]|uniref:Membrane protein n=1 Tax=Corynebacterium felinum TaxID=131318 RepID=A0ABU2B894_9CORY|nr:inner membrane protein YhjD [Corynebacterium felinum]MDF5821285.1 inner membrane protein YhjD [Corynebacterium felinum]MDR7354834.1 membrane protein [Corynebacterium felinum]WJY94194.1 Inner membrane protein YhjD [Corynebacterium felinum]
MATTTRPNQDRTDEYGIERSNADELGFIDRYRDKWPWFDHIMLMNERYTQRGGNQFAAGITYFSVLSMFPLLMLSFAAIASVLANRPDVLMEINERVSSTIEGSLGETVNNIISTAIDQRSAMFGVGGATALWSGLNWMNNLRYGVSKMWNYPIDEGNFVKTKIADFLGLIGVLLLLAVALGITVVGSSGLTMTLLEFAHLDQIPGIGIMTTIVALVLGIVANFLVFFWLLKKLPRGEVPRKSAVQASLIGAVAFEVFKQLGSVFFSSALNNPAGATFGPIIGVMVLFYFIWRILLYTSAWAATSKEALEIAQLDAPAPAVIYVRQEVATGPNPTTSVGVGAVLGAVGAGIIGLFMRKK